MPDFDEAGVSQGQPVRLYEEKESLRPFVRPKSSRPPGLSQKQCSAYATATFAIQGGAPPLEPLLFNP